MRRSGTDLQLVQVPNDDRYQQSESERSKHKEPGKDPYGINERNVLEGPIEHDAGREGGSLGDYYEEEGRDK